MTFDQKLWADQAAVYAAPYPRRQMVADIRQKHLKLGISRAEVSAILGAPTETDKFAKHGLVYWLGPEPGAISVDSQWLLIDFDQADRLASVSITTD